MPGTWQALVVLSAVVVPGYVAWLVCNRMAALRMQTGGAVVAQLAAFGLINALTAMLILLHFDDGGGSVLKLCSTNLCRTEVVDHLRANRFKLVGIAFGWLFLLPMLLGYVAAFLHNRGRQFDRLLDVLHLSWIPDWPTAWDKLFNRAHEVPLWVQVHLSDDHGTVYEGLTWHVNGYPDDQSLVLKHCRRLGENGDWSKVNADYIYVPYDRVALVEAFEPQEPEEPATEPSNPTPGAEEARSLLPDER